MSCLYIDKWENSYVLFYDFYSDCIADIAMHGFISTLLESDQKEDCQLKQDVFISYRRNCSFPIAQMLKIALKEKGINCFLDIEGDHPGQFDDRLFKAISEAHNFILVLTKGSLDGCTKQDDWVRKEILAAVTEKKNIIPVRDSDFKWPDHLNDELPNEIRNIKNLQHVLLSEEYFSATIEKIVQYMSGINVLQNYKQIAKIPVDTAGFFEEGMKNSNSDYCIDMAFHSGSEWHIRSNIVEILREIIEKKIKLRVIVNERETVEDLAVHMRQPLKKYYGYDKSLKNWIEISQNYSDIICVKVAEVPLMHRFYCIRDKEYGIVKVSFYTYGKYNSDKTFQYIFDSTDTEYEIYTDEFEYLWNKASHVKHVEIL